MSSKLAFTLNCLYTLVQWFFLLAGVAELVDAPDSKSGGARAPCRFEPDLRYFKNSRKWTYTVWASFDWVKPVELETALEQQKQLAEMVDAGRLVVETVAVEEALEEWPASQLSRVQSTHSVLIIASEEELSMSRATPMPPS